MRDVGVHATMIPNSLLFGASVIEPDIDFRLAQLSSNAYQQPGGAS
jgi:hypothetical protein